jgi:hypothetical protein
MSHRSVFKSASSAPPSKSARELRIEKFDADKTAFNSALQAAKKVDPSSLEIAPVPGPDSAISDETFLSNLERLPASAPVQRDDFADRGLHIDAPVKPTDSPLVSQFVRVATRDFVPRLDLGDALTLSARILDEEDPIVVSSSTPVRQIGEISLVSAQMPKSAIFVPEILPSLTAPPLTSAILDQIQLSATRSVLASPLLPLTSPRLTATSGKILTSPKRLNAVKSSLLSPRKTATSGKVLTSPRRLRVVKTSDG